MYHFLILMLLHSLLCPIFTFRMFNPQIKFRHNHVDRIQSFRMSTEVVDNKALYSIGDEIVIEPAKDVKRIIMKFGGSSLATAERIVYVSKLIKKHVDQGKILDI